MTFTKADLQSQLSGTVLVPGDDTFDDAWQVVMAHVASTPAAVARVANASDVAAAVTFARRHGLEIAVRNGGHSGAAHGTTDGGLVIDLRDLDAVDVDPDERTVWVGGGATAGAVTTAVGEHGLVIGFGDTASVGVGGLTLAGGQGFLARKFGLAIDNLLAVELVTAAGEIVLASEEAHPDLFWAVRGGGGNLGVVTRFQFRLHELPEVVGGMLMLPATVDSVTRFVELSLAAPDELTTIANVMVAPPMPMIPEHLHGSLVIMGQLAYAGPAAEGEEVVAPFRAIAEPHMDSVQAMPYAGLFGPEPEDYHPIAVSRTGFAERVDRSLVTTILDTLAERGAAPEVVMAAVQLRSVGGAMSRVARDATAYAHREWPLMFNVATMVTDAQHLEAQLGWVEELTAKISDGTPGAYSGFVGNEGPERIHDVYPGETFGRLARAKRDWDPDNIFHRNHTVPPAT